MGEEGRGGEGLSEAGGAVVVKEGASVELTAADLIFLAETVQAEIAPRSDREIVVLGGPLENPDERALLAWATVAGAAVVLLEPTPGARVATAAWVRPTVFHGTPAEIAALRGWVAKERRSLFRRARLPFRRLHTLLVVGADDLPAEEAAFWRERGVRICRRAA